MSDTASIVLGGLVGTAVVVAAYWWLKPRVQNELSVASGPRSVP